MELHQNSPVLDAQIAGLDGLDQTANRRITNVEYRRMESLRYIVFKSDGIHSFDIRFL